MGRKRNNLHFHFLSILKLLVVGNNINIKLNLHLLSATHQAFLHKPSQYPGRSFLILRRTSQFSLALFPHNHFC